MENQNKIKLNNQQIEELTLEIIQLKNQTAKNIMEIGKRLLLIKRSLKHGDFLQYLEQKVDYTSRTAQRFIKVYEEFGNTTTLSDLEPSKLISLTKVPKKDREKFIQDNNIKNMSCRQIEQAIRDMRGATHTKMVSVKSSTQISKQKNPMDTVPQAEESNSTDNIWEDTIKLYDEIILRTGNFYTDANSNLKLTDIESLLISKYLNKEITHNQLKQIIEQNKLNIPFIQDEEKFNVLLNDLEMSNSYEQYDSEGNIYYSVLETDYLNFEDVWNYAWEKDEEERKGYIKDDNYRFTKDNIKIAKGYIDTDDYICIFRDDELFAYYKMKSDYKNFIINLFKFYNIDKKYLSLVDLFIKQQKKDEYIEQQKYFKKAESNAKLTYKKDDECYMLTTYAVDRDCIEVYKDYRRITIVPFEVGMCLENPEFYYTIMIGDWIDDIRDKVKFELKYLIEFRKKLMAKSKKVKKEADEAKRRQEEEWRKAYQDFNFDNFRTKKNAAIDMFTEDEQKFLKDMLQDKTLWKKFYVKTAIKVHPDRVAKDGEIAVKKAENQMKLLNAINDKIQKCC
ncbi:DUF3102 domain-containing protein [Clostridium scatologenes]|uniref:J domain-containing protein n=1 Tax=Clostridium scatologenes TaxID=1548 RepID=A0A0E3K4G0_CLOSL|nr:DUF3102 domain-containing protein [Clostridium scatologenes]AKA71949.1 hypothetical protein CSCA_4824 [Clostridium scatologenes]